MRWKDPAFLKGSAAGAVGLLLIILLAGIAIPNMMRHKVSRLSTSTSGLEGYYSVPKTRIAGGGGGDRVRVTLPDEIAVYADGPRIIRTGQMDLVVENVSDSRRKIEALASAEKGYIEAERTEGDAAKLTIKVPSSRFEAVREQLRKLAKRVRTDASTATDVSKQYIDTDARLRNYRAEEAQFLEILKHARTVADTLAATKELSEVREHIEETDAELQHLKDQIDLSAIEISIGSEQRASYAVDWSAGDSIKSAWQSCRQGLADFTDFLLWLIFYLPVLVLWLIAVYAIAIVSWFLLKRILIPVWKRLFRRPAVVPAQPS